MLSESVIQRARSLPQKPDPVLLKGRYVHLRPLDLTSHLERLFELSNGQAFSFKGKDIPEYDPDTMIWRYMSAGPFSDTQAMYRFLEPQIQADNGLAFCVVDVDTKSPIGVFNLMNNFPQHLKVELGNIWYSPAAQRTPANTEATYLALRHLFDLGYRRVEWKCDALNERSRKAALRLGFTFEGIQEQHFIVKGRNRDTAWFRVLDHEWDSVKQKLESLLG